MAEFNELAAQPILPGNLPRTLRLLVIGLAVLLIPINLLALIPVVIFIMGFL